MSKIKFSVVIPAYNEEKRLPKTLPSYIDGLDKTGKEYEIILVDDGSKDKTADFLEESAKEYKQIKPIYLKPNKGKGGAVQAGMMATQGEYVLMVDADNTTPIEEVIELEKALENGADIAIGSRYIQGSRVLTLQPLYRRLISRFGNLLIQLLLLPGIKDTQCGFKLFKQKDVKGIFSKQTINGFGFDIEILTIAKGQGKKIVEVPVTWKNDGDTHLHPIRDTYRFFRDVLLVKYKQLRGDYR